MRYSVVSGDNMPVLKIISLGYSASPEVTHFGPGRRTQYIIHYVIRGRGWFNGHALTGGQGFLITPNSPEEYHCDPADPWEFLWVISEDSAMEQLFCNYSADPSSGVFMYDYVPVVEDIARKLKQETGRVLHDSETLEMFLHLFNRQLTMVKQSVQSSPDIYFDAAVRFIEVNLSTPLSVGQLTQLIGISQPYLFRIFQSRLGQSPKQYISTRKLLRAYDLLTETDLTVNQISESLGFNDVETFSRFFTRKTGVSPREYRNKSKMNKSVNYGSKP